MGEEQLLAVQLDLVRDADVAHVPAPPGRADRLHHRLLRADALQHRVGSDPLGQLLDAGDALVATLDDDVGRPELAGELLPRLVAAHGDDPLRPHLLRRQHRQQAHRTVADDRDGGPRPHVGRVGREPAGAQHVGGRQEARDQVVRGDARRRHQRPVRQRHAEHRGLGPGDELAVHARRLVAVPAVGARVVGRGERADDELPRLDRPHGAADLLDDAAVFVPHRGGPVDGLEPAIRPEVRPAHAGGRDADDGVRRLDDSRVSRSSKRMSPGP